MPLSRSVLPGNQFRCCIHKTLNSDNIQKNTQSTSLGNLRRRPLLLLQLLCKNGIQIICIHQSIQYVLFFLPMYHGPRFFLRSLLTSRCRTRSPTADGLFRRGTRCFSSCCYAGRCVQNCKLRFHTKRAESGQSLGRSMKLHKAFGADGLSTTASSVDFLWIQLQGIEKMNLKHPSMHRKRITRKQMGHSTAFC